MKCYGAQKQNGFFVTSFKVDPKTVPDRLRDRGRASSEKFSLRKIFQKS